MKVAIMQPYIFPYIGYFQLIRAVDYFIFYDDVNYIKGGWINRNYILMNKSKHLFTISLEKSSPNKLINELIIKDGFRKFLKTINQAYSRAPYFDDVFSLLKDILSYKDRNLGNFAINSLMQISGFLGIETNFIISSTLNKNKYLKGQDQIIDICKFLGADTYINAIGGKMLYNKKDFNKNSVNLLFLKSNPISYNQYQSDFISSLSIIDVMMFNPPEKISEMLNEFKLV